MRYYPYGLPPLPLVAFGTATRFDVDRMTRPTNRRRIARVIRTGLRRTRAELHRRRSQCALRRDDYRRALRALRRTNEQLREFWRGGWPIPHAHYEARVFRATRTTTIKVLGMLNKMRN